MAKEIDSEIDMSNLILVQQLAQLIQDEQRE
jgi:hypothetical protein